MILNKVKKEFPDRGATTMNQEKLEKKTPKLYENKENCCGCSACYAICPVNAIAMKTDDEGFWYPEIDGTKCVCCYKCQHVCIFKGDQEKKGYLS